jgi:putative membrane protein
MIRYAFPAVLITGPASAQSQDYSHMMNWGYGMGMMFGPVLWLVVIGLVVAGVIWVVRRFDHSHPGKSNSDALSVLDMRFANGEIDAEEYAARKKLLMGG